jgi:G3E family GTPase
MATMTNPPEPIVIEASILAFPRGVPDSFLEQKIRNLVLVDGILTVVDGEHDLGLEDTGRNSLYSCAG